jgi:hypothetical protein
MNSMNWKQGTIIMNTYEEHTKPQLFEIPDSKLLQDEFVDLCIELPQLKDILFNTEQEQGPGD